MHSMLSKRALAACALATVALTSIVPAQIFGGRNRRQRPVPTVIQVGTVHPIDAEPIENGVLVVVGGGIVAVGKREDFQVPDDARVLTFEGAHAWPGLVDAWSGSFAPEGAVYGTGGDAATDMADALDYGEPRSRDLARSGITTSYVGSRADARWRGLGAFVRSTERGGRPVRNAPETAVHMNLASPPNTHGVTRAEALRDLGKPFDGLKGYTKAKKTFDKDLAEYEKKYDEYIEHFEKKKAEEEGDAEKKPEKGGKKKGGDEPAADKPAKDGESAESKPSEEPPAPEEKKDGGEKDDDKAEPAPEKKKPAARRRGKGGKKPGKSTGEKGEKGKAEEKAPEKPDYPEEPEPDPAKDVLIQLRDGERPLRVEARRVDEIRAALELQRERAIDSLILEGADAAAELADELAEAGVSVVLGDVEPGEDSPYADDAVVARRLQALRDAGVRVAIGSTDPMRARNLPLVAARAAALGLGEDAAVRAITLDAARVLGLDDRVGSLAPNKVADIVITSGPLLSSRSEILQVFVGGRPVLDTDSE